MPLIAAIGGVLRLIVAICCTYLSFFQVFSSATCIKRSQVDAKASILNRSITYQTKKKGSIKVSNLLGGMSNMNNLWWSSFTIAFIIVCDLKS
jgi:hypothetical protein